MKRYLSVLLLAGTALLGSARAQLLVNVSLERTNFVKHEPLIATVVVENKAGKDIVLGGPNKASWLNVDVRTSDGRIVAPDDESPFAESVVLKKDAVLSRKVNLMAYFPVEEPGFYQVSASVYFPDLQRWLASGRRPVFQVNSPRPAFWERTIGVQEGHAQAGRYRRYKLFTNKSNANTSTGGLELQLVYVQILDEETGMNLTTYPLGEILTYREPQPTTDKEGNLQLLFMSAPQMFTYVVIDCDGAIKERKLYRSGADSPELMQSGDGYVSVRGGRMYDPVAEAERARAKAKETRSLSDRPPGLGATTAPAPE